MSNIRYVNVRFEKYICETDKAYCLKYNSKTIWIPKKICWNLGVFGNDMHAWATIPTWKFNEISGKNIHDIIKKHGTEGLRSLFDCQIGKIVEYHVPEKKNPVYDNTIEDLKNDSV